MQQGAAGLQIMAKGMKIVFQVLWKTSVGFLDVTTFMPQGLCMGCLLCQDVQFYLPASNHSNQL